jgi:molybdenum cofactor cytidylyltransferase
MSEGAQRHIAGILLAAGKGARFDPDGKQNKLLQAMPPHGDSVALTSARHMLAALPTVLAAVRPGVVGSDAAALAAQLRDAGCKVAACPTAEQGMGATLAFALAQLRDADGWLIALADMPHVQPTTITALVAALQRGADIAVPVYQGRRGNPVGFGRKHLEALLNVSGDRGARELLKLHAPTEVEVDDAGVLRDIDTPPDLA